MAPTRKSKSVQVDPNQWRLPPRLQAKLAPPAAASCRNPLCGTLAPFADALDPGLVGMVRASVYGSAEPPRVWCGGMCAAYGMALAEVRVRTDAPVPRDA